MLNHQQGSISLQHSLRTFRRLVQHGFASLFLGLLFAATSFSQAPRVAPPESLSEDSRLKPLKDLDGYFPFVPPKSLEQWQERRKIVREQLLTANGLWPLTERTPLNAVVHGKIDQGDYTIEKVYFESIPGFFVTGNLYRPKNVTGKTAGILCPHGHWSNGRFYDCGPDEVRKLIESGAESFEDGGRSPLQSRCVHLARMGAVVFHYDMIGYADSQQISFDVAHRFAKQRPEMNTSENWGLFSPQAESHLQSVMGLQTYNSIRALDFLESLEDVDPKRLAVTGASGGGTQTFMLAALDDRLATSFPAVMVSTAMQGGCTCENCSLLRIDTGNIEFAAMFAPKPQGMTAADDWTKEMETKGFPQLKELYALYGAEDKVHLTNRLEFGHNYNQVGRTAMYHIFQPVLGLKEDFEERDYQRLDSAAMSVWNTEHPQPQGGDDVERQILATWHQLNREKLDSILPKTQNDWAEYHSVISAGINAVIGRDLQSQLGDKITSWELVTKAPGDTFIEMAGWIIQHQHDERLPVVFLHPYNWNGKVAVWLTGQGKDGLYDASGVLNPEINKLVAAGFSVLGADLLYQGEFLVDATPVTETRRVANPREAAAYTHGYNRSVAAQRVHDVMTLVAYLENEPQYKVEEIHVIGLGEAGPVVATAAPFIASTVDAIYAETNGFRYLNASDVRSIDFMPGGSRYYDLPGFLSLAGTAKIVVGGESNETREWLGELFELDGADGGLTVVNADGFAKQCAKMMSGK